MRARMDRKKIVIGIILLLAAALLLLGLYQLGRHLETGRYQQETVRGELTERTGNLPTITYEGNQYTLKSNLVTILIMGIDTESDGGEPQSTDFRSGGQADFLMMLVLDGNGKMVTQLPIDRDTIAEITTLGVLGNISGTRRAQISLSHGFGDGGAQSAKFTADAVQRLLYGVPVDFYVALNLDAIEPLNDALGGVTVTLADDFSALDAEMVPGATLTLKGKQAEIYVRSRMSVGDGTNVGRMQRQRIYMQSMLQLLQERTAENANYIGTLYDTLGDNLVTDMKRGRMINEANKVRGYDRQTLQIVGSHVIGEDGFQEFHPDEQALEKLVIDTFFTRQ